MSRRTVSGAPAPMSMRRSAAVAAVALGLLAAAGATPIAASASVTPAGGAGPVSANARVGAGPAVTLRMVSTRPSVVSYTEVERTDLLTHRQMAELIGVGPSQIKRGYGAITGGIGWAWHIGDWGDVGIRTVVVAVAEQSCGRECGWAARAAAVPKEYPNQVTRSASRIVAWRQTWFGTKLLELRRAGARVVGVTVSFPTGYATLARAQDLAERVAAAQAARA